MTRLVQVGIRDLCLEEHDRIAGSGGRIRTWYDTAIKEALFGGETFASLRNRIIDDLPESVYVSFDVDGLDPSCCPNTGTPVPGGLGYDQATSLLQAVVRSGRRIVGFDVCEVSPGPSPQAGNLDAIVGMRLVYKLGMLALESQGRLTDTP